MPLAVRPAQPARHVVDQTNVWSNTLATRSYDAFGTLVATTGTPVGPFGFAGAHGYQEDGDSGLKLLGHRYYDPSTGRFLTRDPIQDGRNWYAYCDGNPLKRVDPDGHSWGSLLGGLAGGVASAVIIGASVAIGATVAAPVAIAIGVIWIGGGAALGSGLQGNKPADVKQDWMEASAGALISPWLPNPIPIPK